MSYEPVLKNSKGWRAVVIDTPSALWVEVPPLRAVHARRTADQKSDERRQPVGGMVKRAFDILLSGLAILMLAPLLATIALAIVLQSRGPALFLQRRGGYRGRVFLVYKFRTMTVTDDGDTIDQAKRGDSRVTWLGAILRKASLDELPQLFNVFLGDMSIVGPRPHALAHDKKFLAWVPEYRRRTVARPGITGLAQVSGSRGLVNTKEDLAERVRHDIDYTTRWSLWLDIWIIARTALLVVHDPKAH